MPPSNPKAQNLQFKTPQNYVKRFKEAASFATFQKLQKEVQDEENMYVAFMFGAIVIGARCFMRTTRKIVV